VDLQAPIAVGEVEERSLAVTAHRRDPTGDPDSRGGGLEHRRVRAGVAGDHFAHPPVDRETRGIRVDAASPELVKLGAPVRPQGLDRLHLAASPPSSGAPLNAKF
jgi:hypothetical protein